MADDNTADAWEDDDPRRIYPALTAEQAYAAWPCSTCEVRRDEHADQEVQSAFPELDITDHPFSMNPTRGETWHPVASPLASHSASDSSPQPSA